MSENRGEVLGELLVVLERRSRRSQQGGRSHLGSPRINVPAALWAGPNAPQQIPCSSTPKPPRGCWHLGVLLFPDLFLGSPFPLHALVRGRSLLCRLLLSEGEHGVSTSIFGHLTSIYGHLMPWPDVAAGGAGEKDSDFHG